MTVGSKKEERREAGENSKKALQMLHMQGLVLDKPLPREAYCETWP